MDNNSHRQILRSLRPHGADRLDPEAQSALTATREDPALGAWFEREQAFDRSFSEKIQSAAAPADLRASIFAAVHRLPASQRRVTPRLHIQRPIATLFAALAAAASIALVIMLSLPKSVAPVGVNDLISAATASIADLDAEELSGRPMAELRGWFAAKSAPVPGQIPTSLDRLQTDGAGIVVLDGIVTSVVTFDAPAFSRDGDGNARARRISLFTVPRQSCSSGGISRQPTVREYEGHAIAVWRDATSIYILAVDGTTPDLESFLAEPTQTARFLRLGPTQELKQEPSSAG